MLHSLRGIGGGGGGVAGSSRCARRALVLVFAWCLMMIAALQFRHTEDDGSLLRRDAGMRAGILQEAAIDDGQPQQQQPQLITGGVFGSSRYLLQRYSSIDSTVPSSSLSSSSSSSSSSLSLSSSPPPPPPSPSPPSSLLSLATSDYESDASVEKAAPANVISSSFNRGKSIDEEPLVDKREPRTEEELVREIETRLPSLPLAYWLKTSLQLENVGSGGGGKKRDEKKNKNNNKNKNSDEMEKKWFGNNKSGGGGGGGGGGGAKRSKKGGCIPRFPSIFDLEFNNIYWQSLRTSNGTFQLFGAYYDERKLSRIGPAIRIVGMIDRIEPRVKTHCQMWFDGDGEPAIVETLEYKYVWYSKWGNYKQGIYQPYVIACKVPSSHWSRGPPASVSIVESPCDTSSNNLRVIYNKPRVKRGFAVCVKGLDFLHEDLSVRLVEWIELIGLLGADKIYFYQLQVHPNVSKVLEYYTGLDKIEVTPLTLPGGQPNVAAFQHMYLTKKTNNKRQNELIPYNDCLYKHMYEYEYIALLDIDEVIMPLRDSTWPELMKRILPKALGIRNETRASYNVRNVYFLDDLVHSHGSFRHLPKYMHMLQHVYRSKNFTKPNQYVKCFHNPERVVTLHNHFPLACLGAGCTSYPIETQDAQLQHYRADCVKSLKKTCLQYRENSVMDTTIWRYKDQLIDRVTETLEKLGFFPSSAR